MRDDSIPHNNLHTPLPIKCVIGLTEVKEDFVEDLTPHFCQMLKQLGFEGGGTC